MRVKRLEMQLAILARRPAGRTGPRDEAADTKPRSARFCLAADVHIGEDPFGLLAEFEPSRLLAARDGEAELLHCRHIRQREPQQAHRPPALNLSAGHAPRDAEALRVDLRCRCRHAAGCGAELALPARRPLPGVGRVDSAARPGPVRRFEAVCSSDGRWASSAMRSRAASTGTRSIKYRVLSAMCSKMPIGTRSCDGCRTTTSC